MQMDSKGLHMLEIGKELGKDAIILVNCSGRGDKDVETAAKWFDMNP